MHFLGALYMFFRCFLLGGEVLSCFLGRPFGDSFLIHFLAYQKKKIVYKIIKKIHEKEQTFAGLGFS